MIEVKRFVNISDSPFDGDIFDAMAGGASYMETFAGGSMYNPLLLPQTNPKSILQHYAIGRTLEMMGLQEDYVALALMPMQLSDYLSDREVRVMTLVILDGINTYIKAVYGGRGITDSNGNIGSVSSGYGDLAGIAAEMGKDSGFENSLEAAASAAYGPIGGIIAGSLYGAITGTGANIAGNIAEHTIGTLTGVVSRTAVQGIATSLGITSTLGIMAAAAVIGYALKQAVEVALGLRSGVGFGGQLTGFDSSGQNLGQGTIDGVNSSVHPQYAAQMSFTTALADLSGMRTTTDKSMTAEARAQDALNSYYSANPSERGNTGYGSLASMSQRTATEANQRGLAVSYSGNSTNDSDSDSDSDSGRGGGGGRGASASGAGNSSGVGFSCFTAGTIVKTPLGCKPIEDIKIGDILVGEDSSMNKVLAYDCPLLGDRLVYSINDSQPFITAEHPIKTTKGWKSISPYATMADSLEVFVLLQFDINGKTKSLSIGDEIIKESGSEVVLNIGYTVMSKDTQLYNFKLSGNNTYYANGYLVHNK